MMRSRISVAFVLTLLALGCGGETPVDEADSTGCPEVESPPPAPVGVELDPDDPTILVRPFTAEQIRDEWVPGLRILMRRTFPEESKVERWTVIAADDEGADIEYATVDDDGMVVGTPTTARSIWVELREHASFPAASSTREWVSRSTQAGCIRRLALPGRQRRHRYGAGVLLCSGVAGGALADAYPRGRHGGFRARANRAPASRHQLTGPDPLIQEAT